MRVSIVDMYILFVYIISCILDYISITSLAKICQSIHVLYHQHQIWIDLLQSFFVEYHEIPDLPISTKSLMSLGHGEVFLASTGIYKMQEMYLNN